MAFYTQQVHFTVIECSENTFLAIIQHHSSGTGGGRLWPFIPLCPTMRISPPVLAEEKKTHADCFFPNIPPIQTQPPSYSHMLPHETAWGGACSRSERRTSAESNSDFTVNKFCRQPHLLFQCQSNQTGITVWRRYKKKKKKREATAPKCNPAFKLWSESKLYTAHHFNNSARLCQRAVDSRVASTLQWVVARMHTYKHTHLVCKCLTE